MTQEWDIRVLAIEDDKVRFIVLNCEEPFESHAPKFNLEGMLNEPIKVNQIIRLSGYLEINHLGGMQPVVLNGL